MGLLIHNKCPTTVPFARKVLNFEFKMVKWRSSEVKNDVIFPIF